MDGLFSRAFKTGVRPIELGRRMLREMDEHRSVDVRGRRIVPNQFAFFLSTTDMANFAGIDDALTAELAESAQDYAAQEGYYFMGPITVDFVERPDMKPGRFAIKSKMSEDVSRPIGRSAGSSSAPLDPTGGDPFADYAAPNPADDLTGNPWARQEAAGVRAPGPRGHLLLPTGERVPVGSEPAVIGRVTGCAVVLADLNASRRHAHVFFSAQGFVVEDLNSTNGTLLNGIRLTEPRYLYDGDVITIGSTHLRFEAS